MSDVIEFQKTASDNCIEIIKPSLYLVRGLIAKNNDKSETLLYTYMHAEKSLHDLIVTLESIKSSAESMINTQSQIKKAVEQTTGAVFGSAQTVNSKSNIKN